MAPSHNEIALNRQTVVGVLSATALFLLVTSIAGQLMQIQFGSDRTHEFVRLFYVDLEGNIPTFFSASLLLFSSLLLTLISALKRKSPDSAWVQWAVLSLVLLCMAIDEASRIHESLNGPARWLLGKYATGIFYHAWVILGMAIVLIVTLFYLRFFINLPQQTRRQFFLAAFTFLSGAVGMETVGGNYGESHGKDDLQYSLLATVEEGLEMAGVIIFINALFNYLIVHYRQVRIGLNHSCPPR